MSETSIQYPRYRSHKTVWALKIKDITTNTDGVGVIVPEDDRYAPFVVPAEYLHKHEPKVGGYYVQYADNYQSWSPADAFEAGSTPIDDEVGVLFGFGRAVKELQNGVKVTREGWNGKGMWLYHVPANSYPAQTDAAKAAFGDMVPYRAYIAMKTAQGDVVPWVASQSDILAADWYVV